MCTSIATTSTATGSCKGGNGWFCFDELFLSYDHPFHAQLEHAVRIDIVNSASATANRLAVELSRESARELANRLLTVLDLADEYESSPA
jgi:hypothetical protein